MISGNTTAEKTIDIELTLSDSSSDRGDGNQKFDPGETVYLHLKLTNSDTVNLTPTDDIDVEIDIDGTKYLDDTKHVSADLPPGNITYIVISTSELEDEWNDNLMDYECKSDMEVEVRISNDVESDRDTAEMTIEEKSNDDILQISLDPDQPSLDGELTITVKDDDGDDVDNAKVKVTELGSDAEWDKSDDTWDDRTDDGVSTVTLSKKFGSNARGIFQIDAYKDGYCKDTQTFEISRRLILTGPDPANPQAGKSFRIRVTDESGDALRLVTVVLSPGLHRATSDSNGYARFTISSPGSFTAASAATNYDDATPITVVVSEMPGLSVQVSPDEPTLGDSIVITVSSDGTALSGATVTLSLPDGSDKTFTSSGTGKVVYTGSMSGYHGVEAEKIDYSSGSDGFTVMNTFEIIIPDISIKQEGDDVSVVVKDARGSLVAGASVSVLGTGLSGMTGTQGVYTFKMLKTGSYTVHVTKDGFTPKDVSLTASGSLSIKLSNDKIEVGESVKITVQDEYGIKVIGDIEITKPDGTKDAKTIDEYDYTPEKPGTYTITASQTNYASGSKALTVGLKSLVFDLVIQDNTLRVTALSTGEPAEGVTLTINTPSGAIKEAVTDRDGMAIIQAEDTGDYLVSTSDPKYESGTVSITKKGLGSLIWWVILALLLILFLIMVVGVGVFHWHFTKKKKTKYEREKKSSLHS